LARTLSRSRMNQGVFGGTGLALLLSMRPLTSFALVASFCACGSSADPDTASETSGATSCATNAPLAGASYDVSKSRFAFGSKPTLDSTGGLSRWVGSDGVVAIDANGSELGIMNASAPETNLPDWSSDTARLTQHVSDYWVSMGVVPCQIGIVGIDSSAGGGGSVNGPTMVVAGPSSVALARAIAGVPIVESLAVARFNSSDQTTQESFYWPEIPADVVSAAIAFKNQLATPGALAAYKARLPADAQGPGRVVIHHTSGVTMGAFQSAAAYDVVQTTPENDGGDLNFDPEGTPITTLW
jgi:hypothetical protein